MSEIDAIIKKIVPLNNAYRDPASSNAEKLSALWEIGDIVFNSASISPHGLGWDIQRATKGLIKRPTVFRSHKIRTIWKSKKELINQLGNIRGLSNLTEMLPLIDPEQAVRGRLCESELRKIMARACHDSPGEFKRYIDAYKLTIAHGRLGRKLDRSRHLSSVTKLASETKVLAETLTKLMKTPESACRDQFRVHANAEILLALSNMCVALSTKENIRLNKNLPPSSCREGSDELRSVYDGFKSLLVPVSDAMRARLRRLISPQEFAQLSDLLSSMQNEDLVASYRDRKKISITL